MPTQSKGLSEVSAKPFSIQLDAEDLLNLSQWETDIQRGITSARAKTEYLKSIMRRSGVIGSLALSRDGRSLLVFAPQSNNAASAGEDQAKSE
jgi:hypothetical protein